MENDKEIQALHDQRRAAVSAAVADFVRGMEKLMEVVEPPEVLPIPEVLPDLPDQAAAQAQKKARAKT